MKKQPLLFILIVVAAIALTFGFLLSYWLATRPQPETPPPAPVATTAAEPTTKPAGRETTSTDAVETWNGLLISVEDMDPNAWSLIKAHNQFNDPPLDGRQMLLITLRVASSETSGENLVSISENDFRLMDEQGQIYNTYSDDTSCGVVPDELDGVVSPDHWVRGTVCVQIPKTKRGFQLIYEPSHNSPTVYIPLPEIND